MISLSSAALVALPATHVVSRLASGIADVGRDFLSALHESPEEVGDESGTAAEKNTLAAQNSSFSTAPKPAIPNKPASLADLLKTIQDLIASLSDDSSDSVTIESLSEDEVQVSGDEPLASSIKQWTRIHPEWVHDWNTHAASNGSPADVLPRNFSAKISDNSVKLDRK